MYYWTELNEHAKEYDFKIEKKRTSGKKKKEWKSLKEQWEEYETLKSLKDETEKEDKKGSRWSYKSNAIFTLDTEATTVYITPDNKCHKWDYDISDETLAHYGFNKQDKTKTKEQNRAENRKNFYASCEKVGFVYIWMVSVCGDVYYGRFLEELTEFLHNLDDLMGNAKKIIWVQNLPYDFQYLQDCLTVTDVFCREPRKVMRFRDETVNAEFRDSYILCNMSLDSMGSVYHLSERKDTGALDYYTIRNGYTELTDEELHYCEQDCKTLDEYINNVEISDYGTPWNIPMTQTGKVRRSLKEAIKEEFGDRGYKVWKKYVKECDLIPDMYHTVANDVFMGGYTHANSTLAFTGERDSENNLLGRVLKFVQSYDLTSAYPSVMFAMKFPYGQPTEVDVSLLSEDYFSENECKDFAYVIDFTIEGTEQGKWHMVRSKTQNTYISASKCKSYEGGVIDNGRILTSNKLRMVTTEQDFLTIKTVYNYDKITFNSCKCWQKFYMHEIFIKIILFFYTEKNKYKNVEGFETLYQNLKQKLNSLYGLCVYKAVAPEVIYDEIEGVWDTAPLTDEKTNLNKLTSWGEMHVNYAERVNKANENPLLPVLWGPWITAYVRRILWRCIGGYYDDNGVWVDGIDKYVVYCDTDSIKVLANAPKDVINKHNVWIQGLIKEQCERIGIAYDDTVNTLGTFDYETKKLDGGCYTLFTTLGAKKYCYVETKQGKSKLKMTLSGVRKSAVNTLKSIEDFKPSHVFNEFESGRLIRFYNDYQPTIDVEDEQGHVQHVNQQHGICLMPTTYKLGLSTDYQEAIEFKVDSADDVEECFYDDSAYFDCVHFEN